MNDLATLTKVFCIAVATLTHCQFAAAQETTVDISKAVEAMGTDLRSPFARLGLEKTVLDLYDARVKLAPHRIEGTKEWQTGFEKSFSIFQKRLREGGFEDAASRLDKEVIDQMQASLTKNEKANGEFLLAAQKQSPQLRDVSISILKRSQTYFSIVLSLANKAEWSTAAKRSYIFPFCP